MSVRDIYPGNDLNCGVDITVTQSGAVEPGLTVRAWLSTQRLHSTATPAAAIDPDLDITLTESEPGVSGSYEGAIDKLKIDEHLYDGATSYIGQTLYLHRSDPTGYHAVEACKVRPVRRA